MAFIFTCGTHVFQRLLEGYENVTVQCQNCGNFSAKVYRRWEWFTFCFVPIVPFSLRPWHEVGCPICRFYQDLKYRPDAQNATANVPLQQYGPPPYGQGAPSPHNPPPPAVVSGGQGGKPQYI